MIRKLLLGLLLVASPAWGAGDFTFNGTTSENTDAVVIAAAAHFQRSEACSVSATQKLASGGNTVSTVCRGASFVVPGIVYNFWLMAGTTNRLNWRASSGNDAACIAGYSPSPLSAAGITTWVPSVGVFSSGTNAILYSGVGENTDTVVLPTDDDATLPVVIGARNDSSVVTYQPSQDHVGYIDSVRIYSRKISPEEARRFLYRNARPSRVSPAGLEGYWPMRGVEGANMGTVPDFSNSNRSPGTARGTTLPKYSASYLRGIR